MNIYVGNLHYNVSEDELKEVFSEYGEIEKVRIITDKETGRSRGFGFVTMEDEPGQKAIEELNGAEMGGRALRVNEAIEKQKDNRGGGGGQFRQRRPRREY